MITYTWNIKALDYDSQVGNLKKVVRQVHWKLDAQEQVGDTVYKSNVYGAQKLNEPNPQDFVLYEDLTQLIVEDWLTELLDVPALKNNLDLEILSKENPTNVIEEQPFK